MTESRFVPIASRTWSRWGKYKMNAGSDTIDMNEKGPVVQFIRISFC